MKLRARQAGLALLLAFPVAAQVGGDFELTRVNVTAGGVRNQGGDYSLSSLAGQVEPATASGGAYEHNSGFYAPQSSDRIYSDSFE